MGSKGSLAALRHRVTPPQNPDGNPPCLLPDFLTHDAAFPQQIRTKFICDLNFYFFLGLVSFLKSQGHISCCFPAFEATP